MNYRQDVRCEACGQPTQRLFGVVVGVQDGTRVAHRSAAIAFCPTHQDDVVPHYLTSLSGGGRRAELLLDPPPELRPSGVDAFHAWATHASAAGSWDQGAPHHPSPWTTPGG